MNSRPGRQDSLKHDFPNFIEIRVKLERMYTEKHYGEHSYNAVLQLERCLQGQEFQEKTNIDNAPPNEVSHQGFH